jgi:hypothetical protein
VERGPSRLLHRAATRPERRLARRAGAGTAGDKLLWLGGTWPDVDVARTAPFRFHRPSTGPAPEFRLTEGGKVDGESSSSNLDNLLARPERQLDMLDIVFFWRVTPRLPPRGPGEPGLHAFSRTRLIRRMIGPQDQCLPLAWFGRSSMLVLWPGITGSLPHDSRPEETIHASTRELLPQITAGAARQQPAKCGRWEKVGQEQRNG